ncbi:MAG: cyclic nucleotide-binding domain-containing protein [Sphingomonas phyllosphaerae]
MDDMASMVDGTRRSNALPFQGNALLRLLDEADRTALVPHLEVVPFRNGDMIARAGDTADSICFPLTGIAAILDSLEGDRRYAVALVGSEGFIGWQLLLGNERWSHDVVMRAEHGTAMRLPAAALHGILIECPTIRTVLLRFVDVVMTQMSRTIVSSLAHSIRAANGAMDPALPRPSTRGRHLHDARGVQAHARCPSQQRNRRPAQA